MRITPSEVGDGDVVAVDDDQDLLEAVLSADQVLKDQALQMRAALEASGLDDGPISVHDKMVVMGLPGRSQGHCAIARRTRGSMG